MSKRVEGDSGESSAPSSGLGRGLTGILESSFLGPSEPVVSALFPARPARQAPQIRQLVTDLAVEVLAHSFGAGALTLVRREAGQTLAVVVSRSNGPGQRSAQVNPSVDFEMSGRLWAALTGHQNSSEQVQLGGSHLLLIRQSIEESVVAVAMLRTERFGVNELRGVDQLLRSVAMMLGEGIPAPPGPPVQVLLTSSGDEFRAAVEIGASGSFLSASSLSNSSFRSVGVAASEEVAIASAAAKLCDSKVSVRFAGRTVVQAKQVSLVILHDSEGLPLFGLSVTDLKSMAGPAEAAFAAAPVIGAGPFAR